MKNKLISFILALCLLIAIPLEARYKYNPFTRKLDYYETGADIDLGDLADVTLTGLATGNVLYYDGSAWVNLATGVNTQFLTLAAGIPAWQAIPAGVTTFVGLNDTPANYVGKAGQLVRVNAGANALEFFAGSPLGTVIIADGAGGWTKTENFRVSAAGNVTLGTWQGTAVANTYVAGLDQNCLVLSTPTFADITVSTPVNIYALSHNSFADYAANRHADHTAVSILSGGLITGGGTIDGNQTLTLSEATIESNIDTLANLTSIQGQTVTFSGSLNVEANSNINQDVTSDGTPTFGGLTITNIFSYDYTTDHNLLVGYLAGQDLTATEGQYNTLFGEQAGTDQTTGDENVMIGYQAGFIGTTNATATFIGYQAGYNLEGTSNNVAIGWKAMYGVSPTGYGGNTAVGTEAFTNAGLESLRNTVIGYQALHDASDEAENITAIGYRAGAYLTTPASNSVLIGSFAGNGEDGVSDYEYNVIIGTDSGGALTSGSWNTVVGNAAGCALTSAAYNVIIGHNAADKNVTGDANVVIGTDAAEAGGSFTNNVIIGYQAAEDLTTGSNNIVIGYMAGEGWLDTGNEKLVIDVTDTATPLIYGDFSADNITINGDFIVRSDVALDQVLFVQESESGTENQPYVWIDDGREGATVDEWSEASLRIQGEGYGLAVIAADIYLEADIEITENLIATWGSNSDHLEINMTNVTGTDGQPLIFIDDDRTGAYADSIGEATIVIDAAGAYGLYVADGFFRVANWIKYDETLYNQTYGYLAGQNLTTPGMYNILMGHKAGYDLRTANYNVAIGYEAMYFNRIGQGNVVIGAEAAESTSGHSINYNVIIGEQAGQGMLDGADSNVYIGRRAGHNNSYGDRNIFIGDNAGHNEMGSDLLYIEPTSSTTPLIKGDFSADNVTINGDFNVTMDAALDQIVIAQSSTTGTEGQPLILIDDDRTGSTANEIGEAALVIDSTAVFGFYVKDGDVWFAGGNLTLASPANLYQHDDLSIYQGSGNDIRKIWSLNGAGDDLLITAIVTTGTNTAALPYANSTLVIAGMTDHDNYVTPTFVMMNNQGADSGDYAGVVIGERTQANVKIAHYFDFYAMAGAGDGLVDTADELAAIFRFGASGSAVPDYATTPGDVLFEGSIEIDGNVHTAGYHRTDMIFWQDSFSMGTEVTKYEWAWEIEALNTQGIGTNTIDTNPSNITLTTEADAVGDNEGTRSELKIIERAKQNRSGIGIDLGQTANTQFYFGWNDSGTNAMVSDADKYVIVFFDKSDDDHWQIKVGDGATEDVFTSTIAADTNHIGHEIWVETDGTVHWLVNGTELDITGPVDNKMDADPHYLIVGQAQSVTGAAAIVVNIDYIENEKTKSH